MTEFRINPLSEGQTPAWNVRIDGRDTQASHVEISNPKFGTLTYGRRPEGYDGWAFEEVGGGGAITIPYTVTPAGETLVGLIEEDRPNMGGKRWCAIGGFLQLPESHSEAQTRELKEEADIDVVRENTRSKAVGLGIPLVSNRAFFVADPMDGKGVHAFGLHIPFEQIQNNSISEAQGKLGKAVFFHWTEAVTKLSGDALACAGIAQLMAQREIEKTRKV